MYTRRKGVYVPAIEINTDVIEYLEIFFYGRILRQVTYGGEVITSKNKNPKFPIPRCRQCCYARWPICHTGRPLMPKSSHPVIRPLDDFLFP